MRRHCRQCSTSSSCTARRPLPGARLLPIKDQGLAPPGIPGRPPGLGGRPTGRSTAAAATATASESGLVVFRARAVFAPAIHTGTAVIRCRSLFLLLLLHGGRILPGSPPALGSAPAAAAEAAAAGQENPAVGLSPPAQAGRGPGQRPGAGAHAGAGRAHRGGPGLGSNGRSSGAAVAVAIVRFDVPAGPFAIGRQADGCEPRREAQPHATLPSVALGDFLLMSICHFVISCFLPFSEARFGMSVCGGCFCNFRF